MANSKTRAHWPNFSDRNRPTISTNQRTLTHPGHSLCMMRAIFFFLYKMLLMASYKMPSSWDPSAFWLSSQKFSISSKHCSLSNDGAHTMLSTVCHPLPPGGCRCPPSASLP